MKVLYNTYPMAFHTPGGGELQVLAYERHLPALGVEVTRFDLWKPRFREHDLVHYFSCVGGSWHFCNFVRELGLPLVISSSLWVTEETAEQYPIAEIRDQLSLADRVITNSQMESDTLARVLQLPLERFRAVPNAVEERLFAPADPQLFRTAFGVEGPFILNVGNIEPRKNQARLAEAAKALDLPLLLIGRIRDAGYWAQVQAVGHSGLRHIGYLDPMQPALPSAYAACSVFALPSLLETPGLAALEASAQGAPLVVTEVGSTREYFGTTCHYVEPHSTASIADGLRQGLATPRGTAAKPVAWAVAAARLHEIYLDALND